jgi:hypothetical protein
VAENVRVAMFAGVAPLKWPERCPRCGSQKDLIYLNGRVVRETFVGFRFRRIKQEIISIPILMCREHAIQNEIGGKILERGIAMNLFRGVVYISIVFSIVILIQIGTGQRAFASLVQLDSRRLLYFMGFGYVGLIAIIWARLVTSVRPVQFDPDYDVAVLRFSDEKYAREFKRANIKATSGALTQSPPFFMRASFWKMVLVVGLLIFIFIKTGH